MRAVLLIISACTLAIGLWCGSAIPIKPQVIYHPLTTAKYKLAEEDPVRNAELIALLDEGIRKTKERNQHLEKVLGDAYALSCLLGSIGILCGLGSPWRTKTPSAVTQVES